MGCRSDLPLDLRGLARAASRVLAPDDPARRAIEAAVAELTPRTRRAVMVAMAEMMVHRRADIVLLFAAFGVERTLAYATALAPPAGRA